MMRSLLVVLLIFTSAVTFGQNLEIRYKVIQSISIALGEKRVKNMNIDYDGYVYQAGKKTISFLKPLFLDKYPTGEILLWEGSNAYSHSLSVDTQQLIFLYDTDSMNMWKCLNSSDPETNMFITQKFEKNITRWQILSDTKKLKGLTCKRAKLINAENELICDIWYTTEVPNEYNLAGLTDLPGMIVSANYPMAGLSFELGEFKMGIDVNNDVFWPAEFRKAKFTSWPALLSNNRTSKPKLDKRAEIMNQQ